MEQISLLALMIVFFKVLIKSPACLDLFDGYFTILPLFLTKTLELSLLKPFQKQMTKN